MVCDGIVAPVPEAVNPLTPTVAVAVHVKVVPDGLADKATGVVALPEQIVWLVSVLVTTGATLTVKI
jgi:hypothetical protein